MILQFSQIFLTDALTFIVLYLPVLMRLVVNLLRTRNGYYTIQDLPVQPKFAGAGLIA
jgi:hypothetical protein